MELRDHVRRLATDSWRAQVGFSDDIQRAHDALFAGSSDDAKVKILKEWLGRHQPCLFGRLAARAGALSICVLSSDDLSRDDEHIKTKIQAARLEWSREAYRGKSSGFIVAVVCKDVAWAVPDEQMLEFARRLAFLYLREEISVDRAHQEDVCLEIPGDQHETWLWRGGVNYFSAAGDRRWWHDHRIPGGMSFSVNSVGHLVKSGRLATDADTLNELMGIANVSRDVRIDTLPKALEFAMRTIDMAANAVSGKATELLPKPSKVVQACPVVLPPNLAAKDYCEYRGWYDTDSTLPAEYFTREVERPAHIQIKKLDFTYLFDDAPDDGDFDLMGEGRRIRVDGAARRSASIRAYRGSPLVVPIEKLPLLRQALLS